MGEKEAGDQHNEAEIVERRESALKRMLSTPPKPHDEMKLGKGRKLPGEPKTRPSSKGRVHKGKTRD
jgi:hypothetical protein